ncbi:MAG: transposase family protein [Verrucomicrobiota bacterium]
MIAHFQDLPDPRVNRTKDHELIDVLTIAICTLLCAGESFNDMADFGAAKEDWPEPSELEERHPESRHLQPGLRRADPQAFGDCFMAWTQSLRAAVAQEIVALDGKALAARVGYGSEQQGDRQRVGAQQRIGAGATQGGGQEQ